MTDAEIASTNAAADQNRDDLVDRLKREAAEATRSAAEANARMEGFVAREKARIAGWQPDCKDFMCDFINAEVDEHHPQLKDDVAVFTGATGWAHTYTEKPDIQAQGALAAVSYVASKGIKRLREQASQGAAAQATLAETMKQNEELTAQNAKLQKDYQEAMTLCDERQKGLETLQAELIKGGLMNEKFNFSKLTSREQVDEPHAAAGVGAAAPSLEVVKAEASKAATGSSGNPIQQQDLLQSLLNRSSGGLRMGQSATQHAFLGATGEADIGSLIRGSA